MKLPLKAVRRAIVVAPHPDDEIIGAAGVIQALRRQGSLVRVIVVSNGAASHPNSGAWPPERLIAARRRESLLALRRLGVTRDHVTFLGLPDGGLSACAVLCRQRLSRAIRQCRDLDMIVGPAMTDAHPDHRAVAAALRDTRFAGRRMTYQVWPPQRARVARGRTITLAGGAAAKRSLIRMHRTQLGAITDDPHGFAVARHELAVFAHPVEQFVEQGR
ncbi:PIG-L family deacetylase [Sphingomonas sanguinis]|uniref:PIG-L family deacetylase n=1 Tax=Sphingomonas sanguinis TaxID=33051 RepID=A0ABU5LKE8_9SPHN|nr:PIG-L family deacetylase [Sphingomonas sanguinis]MDZ7280413.1 PIG-L family deacetylase [Sphingomonas sanguinis]